MELFSAAQNNVIWGCFLFVMWRGVGWGKQNENPDGSYFNPFAVIFGYS